MATIRENNGEASSDSGTTYTISLGDVFQGMLESVDDKDWIKVELSAGTIYDFTLSGIAGEMAELTLFDSEGNHVVSGGAIPTGAKLIFSPSVSGTYYIRTGSYDDSLTGDYELSLVESTSPVGTYDEIADYLIDGFYEWYGGYGSTRTFNVGPGGTLTANITALSEDNQKMARWGLEAWANVTGIQFQFVDQDDADIIFDNHEAHHASGYFLVNDGIVSGYVNAPESFLITYGATIGSRNFMGFLHEIGHALGLAHVGAYSGYPVYYGHHNVFVNDSQQLSVMSYLTQAQNTYVNASLAEPVTPMIVDIIAIQKLYGIPTDVNPGDTVYGYQSNLDGYLGEFFRLWTGEANPFSTIQASRSSATPTVKPALADLDNDGDPDLVIGNDTGLLYYFENTGTMTEPDFTQRAGYDNPFHGAFAGFWIGLDFTDLNGDGHPDLIVGNTDGIIHYFKNTGTHGDPEFSPQRLTNPTTFTIYDNGGNDTLDLRTDTQDQRVYLHPEGISDVYGLIENVIIARDTWIENFIAGSGDDFIVGNAVANDLNGREGNDRLLGSGGRDQLDGGAGSDVLSYELSDAGVSVNLEDGVLTGGYAQGDVITGIEHVMGSDYQDMLTGAGGANELYGLGGDDELRGNGGDDVLEGGAGADRLDGAAGTDWLSYAGSDGAVSVRLYDGYAARGHAEGDTLSGFENLRGSAHADILAGSGRANRLEGGADRIIGGAGNDRLHGNAYNRDEGDRTGSVDVFVFDVGHGDDSIYGFVDNEDKIDLSAFGLSGFDDLTLFSNYFGVTTIDLTAYGGGTIRLFEFDIANLDASDFLF